MHDSEHHSVLHSLKCLSVGLFLAVAGCKKLRENASVLRKIFIRAIPTRIVLFQPKEYYNAPMTD